VLKVRVIPTLLHKDFGLVKGQRFDSRRAVGAPMQAIKVYNLRGVDELVFFDVTATLEARAPDYELIDHLADDCFMPFTVGGGICETEHVRRLLAVGADKVAIGTAAVERPEIVTEASSRFGSQCVVAVLDVRRDGSGEAVVHIRSGSTRTNDDPVMLARELAERGAGELLVQSIDRDGLMVGYDIDLIHDIAAAVSIPVIASGGAGTYSHMADALRAGASAVAAASMFHFTEQTPQGARDHLRDQGFPVRR
jgi:cyclase